MTRAEFAKLLKEKYPVYANIPDEELVSQVLEKHPQYRTQVEDPHQQAGSVFDFRGGETTEGGQPVEHEPDTWMGGFGKGLKAEFMKPLIDAMRGPAHPTSMGDILPLLLPQGITGAAEGGMDVARAAARGYKAAPKIRNIPGSILKAVGEEAFQTPSYLKRTGIERSNQAAQAAVKAAGVESNVPNVSGRGAPLQDGLPLDELALSEQGTVDRYMPNQSGRTVPDDMGARLNRVNRPQGTEPPPPANGSPNTRLPQSLESQVQEMVGDVPAQGADWNAPGAMGVDDTSSLATPVEDFKPNTSGVPGSWPPDLDPNWHSGAEPGSAEAGQARTLHREDAALNQRAANAFDLDEDPTIALLIAALGGGGLASGMPNATTR